jgi:hypothetical protein
MKIDTQPEGTTPPSSTASVCSACSSAFTCACTATGISSSTESDAIALRWSPVSRWCRVRSGRPRPTAAMW